MLGGISRIQALILVVSNRAIMATIMKVLKMPVRPRAMYTGAINAGPRPYPVKRKVL